MSQLNKIILIGRLGNQPDIINGGCKLRLAINGTNKGAIWVSVYVFGRESDSCLTYKKKGDKVLIEGKFALSTATDKVIIIADIVTFM